MTAASLIDVYRSAILARLDQIDEREMEASAVTADHVDMFVEMITRYRYAQAAFPGISWEDFGVAAKAHARRGKRGAPKLSLEERGHTPIARAARDVDRIELIWRELWPHADEPPISAMEIAAARHSVDEADVGERMRRPLLRQPHRLSDRR